jgi:hypothetical protein
MPVLPPAYFGSLQKVKINSNWYLLEKFSQTQKATLSPKPMIQGTIGTRVMDVGELIWETNIESSALILQTGTYFDSFNLVSSGWNNIRSANNSNAPFPSLPLMESATITINKEKVSVDAKFVSGANELSLFTIQRENDTTNFIARLAKWYDCTLLISQGIPMLYGIETATINLKAKITPRFFIGFQSQEPFFSIDNYEVSGSMTVVATAADMANYLNYIAPQAVGSLQINGPVNLSLLIGNAQTINLGLSSLKSEYTRTVAAGDVNRISIKFTSFTT